MGTADGAEVTAAGQVPPLPVPSAGGPVRVGLRVRRRVDDAVPLKVPRPVATDAVAPVTIASQHPHAVPMVVHVDAAVPTARLTVDEVGVADAGGQGPRVKGRQAGAAAA